MMGLVIKDLMCMKKTLRLFVYVVVSAFAISIMVVLSEKFGNIAKMLTNMLENGESEIDVISISQLIVIMFLMLPLGAILDFSIIFRADRKAGFMAVSSSLPVSVEKRVLAKYITVLMLFGLGIIVDAVLAVILSNLSKLISLKEYLGIIVSFASVQLMVSALIILFCMLFKGGHEDYATICAIITLVAVWALLNFKKTKEMLTTMFSGGYETENPFIALIDFLMNKSYILVLAAVVTVVISYFASVLIAKRKRGII